MFDYFRRNPDKTIEGGREGLKSWMMVVIRNVASNRAKEGRRKYAQQLPVHFDAEILKGSTGVDEVADPLDFNTYRDQLTDEQARAIESLPSYFRDPFVLFVFGHCSYDEIAHRLNIRVGTVMSRLYRARQRIKDSLAPTLRKD